MRSNKNMRKNKLYQKGGWCLPGRGYFKCKRKQASNRIKKGAIKHSTAVGTKEPKPPRYGTQRRLSKADPEIYGDPMHLSDPVPDETIYTEVKFPKTRKPKTRTLPSQTRQHRTSRAQGKPKAILLRMPMCRRRLHASPQTKSKHTVTTWLVTLMHVSNGT